MSSMYSLDDPPVRGLPERSLRVLRLCTSFMPPEACLSGRGAACDPIGGMQNHTLELTKALDGRGVKQSVVTTRPAGSPRLTRVGRRAVVLRLGLPVRRFRQLYSLPAASLVPRLAKDADVIHAHLGEDLAILPLAALASRRCGIPLVITVHCSLAHTLGVVDIRTAVMKTLGGAIEQRVERSADALIALTPRLAGLLLSCGVDSARIHVIPPGVDPKLFSTPFEDPWPELPGPRVLFVGRLVTAKGVLVLVEALRHLAEKNAQVIFVGNGPQRAAVEEAASRLGVRERVHVTGWLPHDKVPGALQHADVLVLPSLYEELGSILVEAMAAGIPIVASDVGGIPDVITHGHNGLLVPPRDPVALAGALDRLLLDPRFASTLAAHGRARASLRSWEAVGAGVLDVYRGALGSHAGRESSPPREDLRLA